MTFTKITHPANIALWVKERIEAAQQLVKTLERIPPTGQHPQPAPAAVEKNGHHKK